MLLDSVDESEATESSEPSSKPVETILTWTFMRKNYPWQIVLLVGSGRALSELAEVFYIMPC